MKPALQHAPGDLINGQFISIPGEAIVSRDPADPARVIWRGSPRVEHVDAAIGAARRALPDWSSRPLDERVEFLHRWQQVTTASIDRIAGLITDETGKTLAESQAEAKLLGEKVAVTLDEISLSRVRDYQVAVSSTRKGICRFKPHGVMAVIGSFNFPAHLPNGHFIPALLLGNAVVLKPSEKTPGVGQLLGELMQEVGMPPGVFNVVQGAADVASTLVSHDGLDGIAFTGSWGVGRRIMQANQDRPGRILALEMGGNNAAVVMNDAPLKHAVIECVRAAFITTGQRCTCTRRIIVQRGIAQQFISAFCKAASTLVIGPGRSTTPVFMGPLISAAAVDAVLSAQQDLVGGGARMLVQATRMDGPGHFITPGVVEVDRFSLDRDREIFGPFVQIAVVDDLDHAIEQANATRYGLAASIFTADDDAYERFFRAVRCGCINRNTGTAGASSRLPFGGTGHSGNHRPAAAFSVKYCAYPVANMVETAHEAAIPPGMHWNDAWL